MDWLWIGGGIVVLLIVLVTAVRSMRPKPPAPPTLTTAPSGDVAAEIDALMRDGNKIQAIKRLRDATPGLGLAEAKQRIESWVPGMAPAPAPAPAPAADGALPPDLVAEIDALLAEGQPITAIKLLRERTGWGLKESKHRVDRWVPGRG